MVDRYTKMVLTIIATALVVLVGQNFVRPASAQLGDGACGDLIHPCYITASGAIPVAEQGMR
jgi:hypothetical protein